MSEIPPIKTLVTIEPLNVANTAQNNAQTNTVLNGVANGTLIEGFVVNRTPGNQPVLRTQLGDVLLNTELFLKTGTEVTIRVDNSQPNLARIVTINGQTPEQFGETQRLQATKLQNDSLASSLLTNITASESLATPKPVQLSGVMLQVSARQTLPPPLADNVLKALGIAPSAIPQKANSSNIPLSVALRSIITPQVSSPSPPISSPSLQPQPPIPPALPQTQAPTTAPALSAIAETQTQPPVLPGKMQDSLIPTQTRPTTSPSSVAIPQTPTPPLTGEAVSTPLPLVPVLQPQQAIIQTPPLVNALPPGNTTATIPTALSGNPVTPPAQQFLAHTQPPAAVTPAPPQQLNTPEHSPTIQATAPLISPSIPATASLTHAPITTSTQPLSLPHTFSEIQVTPERAVVLQGLVIGQEQQSDTILHTSIGSMRIFTPKPLPSGTIVTMELSAPQAEKKMGATPELFTKLAPLDPVESLLREWPELSDLGSELERTDPELFQNTLARALPTPGKQLTHMMLFFLSAVKSGDLKQWIGSKNSDILESRYGEIVRKLGTDFTSLQQIFSDPSPQGWVSTSIPIYYNHTIEHARLHLRQDPEETPNKKQQGGQRFIIDIELSRLGEMQIDGLVQKDAGKHQFDMIIRTGKPLPTDIESDIRTIYNNASETAGFKGMLIFQPSREHFVTIKAKSRSDGQNGIIA